MALPLSSGVTTQTSFDFKIIPIFQIHTHVDAQLPSHQSRPSNPRSSYLSGRTSYFYSWPENCDSKMWTVLQHRQQWEGKKRVQHSREVDVPDEPSNGLSRWETWDEDDHWMFFSCLILQLRVNVVGLLKNSRPVSGIQGVGTRGFRTSKHRDSITYSVWTWIMFN